ncbi:unnamed protein product [Didymodactylos carnosus]|uniref:Uncharacterized protein n=1 Tax=Didymodactylos carnosus TaxID=1234261 RepID=A0A8S2NKQ5_9BILA|nr:unnamed protein product [Didymodactylos carnosus]CAF4005614.1 unnamed protein product [Didymodactylos carnosus]
MNVSTFSLLTLPSSIFDILPTRYEIRILRLGGEVCNAVTGAQLFSNCTLVFTPTDSNVYYAAAIMIEDFYPYTTTALSSSPLQFLIFVYDPPSACSTLPTIIGSYTDQSCVPVQASSSFSFSIISQIGCIGTNISELVALLPYGMIRSSFVKDSTNPNIYSVQLNWTLSASQTGTQLFCAAVLDTNNVQSSQYCLKFIIGTPGICPITTRMTFFISE